MNNGATAVWGGSFDLQSQFSEFSMSFITVFVATNTQIEFLITSPNDVVTTGTGLKDKNGSFAMLEEADGMTPVTTWA